MRIRRPFRTSLPLRPPVSRVVHRCLGEEPGATRSKRPPIGVCTGAAIVIRYDAFHRHHAHLVSREPSGNWRSLERFWPWLLAPRAGHIPDANPQRCQGSNYVQLTHDGTLRYWLDGRCRCSSCTRAPVNQLRSGDYKVWRICPPQRRSPQNAPSSVDFNSPHHPCPFRRDGIRTSVFLVIDGHVFHHILRHSQFFRYHMEAWPIVAVRHASWEHRAVRRRMVADV